MEPRALAPLGPLGPRAAVVVAGPPALRRSSRCEKRQPKQNILGQRRSLQAQASGTFGDWERRRQIRGTSAPGSFGGVPRGSWRTAPLLLRTAEEPKGASAQRAGPGASP